jgi:hypothetical protein
MIISDQGSVVSFTPESDYEYEWMTLNLETEDWQWLGRTLVVDHRPARDLIELLEGEGFILDR